MPNKLSNECDTEWNRAKFLHSSNEAATQTEKRISNPDPNRNNEEFKTSTESEVVKDENGEIGVEVEKLAHVQEGNV